MLLDFSLSSGENVSLIYAYNKSLPIAKAINATNGQIFHTSFEDVGEGNSSLGDSKTGNRSSLNGFARTISNLANGPYILNYWQKTNGNWSLLSQSVNVATGSYTISLTGQVDDIKFYPAHAQMETYTHRPGVGITSKGDAKGLTTYFQHDAANRLQAILDEKGDVVKSFNYKYYKP